MRTVQSAATHVTKAAHAVSVAYAQLGTPYKWAGDEPGGFDCSGLIKYCYGLSGIVLPHSANQIQALCKKVAVPLPGDLWFGYPGDSGAPAGAAGHVEMVVGPAIMIGADTPGTRVRIDTIFTNPNVFLNFGRVPGSGLTGGLSAPTAGAAGAGCLMTMLTLGLVR